ncbi:bifunctional sulfate adenylyltransferase/adenylylsulfate kinase [Planctomycetota bacterium]
MPHHLIEPHGGVLKNLLVSEKKAQQMKKLSRDWPSWDLTARQICDLELLLNGSFSPLEGFMTRGDYDSVCRDMRLRNGTLWPLPIVLDVTEEVASKLQAGADLALRDPEGTMLAVLHVEEIWQPDRIKEAKQVFGTTNTDHPGVKYLLEQTHSYYIGGKLEGIATPSHYDFVELRFTPAELRNKFILLGWQRIVAFQTRNPMHRAHLELTFRAAADLESNLLIHPVVGMTKPGDVDHYTRVRCYKAILQHYPKNTALLSLLPLAMRMGGPREALLHAIVRKNYGCTHLIVGRDHAGPGSDSSGTPFYGPYAAQELLRQHEQELGIRMVPFKMMVYVEDKDAYMPIEQLPANMTTRSISGTELRDRLANGRDIPSWFSFPEVIEELRRTYPPRGKQGFTVFFTGLPSSGKSTLAQVLITKLMEIGGRPTTLLDGDLVRKHLSSELGFSKAHRDINIRRIGWVASEITKNGGIAVCAPIAPYDRIRKEIRDMIKGIGGFVLVHVATPVEICEQRDCKGLYAKARAGIVKEFTGVSDPYEEPDDAEIRLDTTELSPQEAVQRVILYLEKEGFICPTE